LPDFIVKQLVTRSYARGTSKSWVTSDRLTVLVSYREGLGERYKLMFKNDQAVAAEEQERGDYAQTEGTTSTGEFASRLTALFAPETNTIFKAVDTDVLRNARTIVYEYEVKQPNSKHRISAGGRGIAEAEAVIVGYRGRIWVDREQNRVLRLESTALDIPAGFPVTAAFNRIDYDWATINNKRYLMPLRAELELTVGRDADNIVQSRNDIRFRNYRKFGSSLEITIDDDEEPPGN